MPSYKLFTVTGDRSRDPEKERIDSYGCNRILFQEWDEEIDGWFSHSALEYYNKDSSDWGSHDIDWAYYSPVILKRRET